MKNSFSFVAALAVLIGAAVPNLAQPGSPDGLTYKTSLSSVVRLGQDLYTALPRKYRDKVHVQPVSVETDVMPFVRLEEYPDDVKPMPMVFISVGFIDLVNNVAHAKAIDKVKKGYFQNYVGLLAKERGDKSLLELPDLDNKKYWTDDVLNEQLSNFNSIVGTVIGVKLAHHYLGHYKKYAAKLMDSSGKRIPINNLLTEAEWEEAIGAGVRNALDAGCMVEGVVPFFETFDKMSKRPEWTAYFMPDFVKYKSLKKTMEKIQQVFLTGE